MKKRTGVDFTITPHVEPTQILAAPYFPRVRWEVSISRSCNRRGFHRGRRPVASRLSVRHAPILLRQADALGSSQVGARAIYPHIIYFCAVFRVPGVGVLRFTGRQLPPLRPLIIPAISILPGSCPSHFTAHDPHGTPTIDSSLAMAAHPWHPIPCLPW